MSYVLYTWGRETNSAAALQIVEDAQIDIRLVDVRHMRDKQIPAWLDGCPTLLEIDSKSVYYGSDALDELERLGGGFEANKSLPADIDTGRNLPAHISNMKPDLMYQQQQQQKRRPPAQAAFDDNQQEEHIVLNGRRVPTSNQQQQNAVPMPDIDQLINSGGVTEQRASAPTAPQTASRDRQNAELQQTVDQMLQQRDMTA